MLHHSSTISGHKFNEEENHFINWLKAGLEGWDNTDLSDLSARNHFWEHDAPLFKGGDGFIAEGFYNIVQYLAKPLKNLILLNHVVKTVEQDNSHVIVHTNQGSFFGDFLICTLPLGVLKNHSVLFSPSLPDWKEESIEKIGFGLMNKIYIQFPEIFWNPIIEGLGYISESHRGEFGFFLTLHHLLKKPVLVCFVAAEFAKKVEKWTDQEIIDRIMEILSSIYGKNDKIIPKPTHYVMSRWFQDPFARGSYSFMRVHSTPKHLENLARPVGRIHFAGEATAKYPGYTHGAYISAKREVDRIFNKISGKNQLELSNQTQLVPAYASQATTKSKL